MRSSCKWRCLFRLENRLWSFPRGRTPCMPLPFRGWACEPGHSAAARRDALCGAWRARMRMPATCSWRACVASTL
eukprot:3675247-Prymnesium_polylepis.1